MDILALLALSDVLASLWATWEAWVSSAGRGMPDGLWVMWGGSGLRFLGAPRIVPVCDMPAGAGGAGCLAGSKGRW